MDAIMNWILEHAGLIGLLFFFSFFTANLLWVMRPGSKKIYEDNANIPLREAESKKS